MYRSKECGLMVYESMDELLGADIVFVVEYDGFYYFRLEPEEHFDNTVWKVDKQTKEISCIHLVEYFDIEDKATRIDPSKLRRVS